MGGGAASGGIATGTMEGVMWGAFSGAVFFGVGQAFGGTAGKNGLWGSSFKDAGELARASLAHGVAGGTISHLQGGKFGHGFVSAGVSKSFSTRISGAFDGNALAQGTATAIVGGTTSRLTGGKFANGAVTAAMAFAFNQMLGRGRIDEDRGADEFSGVCSEDTCVSYLWSEIEPRMIPGAPRPAWAGVDAIEDWINRAPPIGSGLDGRLAASMIGHYSGTETGINLYPHVRRYQFFQVVDDRSRGVFSKSPVPGAAIRYGSVVWRPSPQDNTQLTRMRWKTCVGNSCFHWPR